MKRFAVLIICLAVLLSAVLPADPAFAFNHYSLDVDALKELQQKDEFDLKISKKTVTDGVRNSSGDGPDILTLQVSNDSNDAISKVVILLVFYDEAGVAQNPSNNMEIVLGPEKRNLTVMTFDSLSVSPMEAFELNVPCTHSHFSGAQALVAQYTTADGKEITNPLTEEWQELALGSPTHILD